ncbi:MAG: ABC transporter ATP-binding protein [Anaerolineae bacterium]|jgi:spermidine/putrescine ABC transporter ATP-binding subunit|nr:ABC transporter ATP-binding protein [Anaerolineae bacterium]MDH7474052.1 ABC transporter ATP-binding protein [Anaerolineae bacterium]
MPALRLVNLTKRFGKTVAVQDVSLEIRDGEIMTLLGPSGCGKTTTLRCIAGLLSPDEGDIYLDDRRVTDLPPEKRGIGLVFQNYALWPHMTIYENLAFGLRLRKIPKDEIQRKVSEVLATVRLSGFEQRYPRQLSGGQQQRVALARALVIEPSVLLLDEPLSNLDAQLREEMRFEIRELQRKFGITTVYVTHDQAEALVLSDRITVLHGGKITQVGTPKDIYNRPSNKFVAGFIGLTSFIEGTVVGFDETRGYAIVKTSDGLEVQARSTGLHSQQKVTLAVRPEHIELLPGSQGLSRAGEVNVFEGVVLRMAYLGDTIDYRVRVGDWVLRAHTSTNMVLNHDEKVWVVLSPDQITVIPE